LAWLAAAALALSTVVGCGAGAGGNTTGQSAANTANDTAATPPPPKTYTGKTIATYTGGDVKKDELDQLYNLLVVLPGYQDQESKSDFLTYYIVWYKYIYEKAAQDKSVKVDIAGARDLAEKSIDQLVGTKYKTKDDVLKAMKDMGVSEDDLVRLAIKGQYIRHYVQSQMKDLKVSDAAVADYYNKHKDEFTTVTVEHILVNSLADAKKVEAELKAGADFAKTADKYSKDPGVKENHGKYADSPVTQFVPEFAKAAETLPIGKVSDPVHTQFGYHIMRVDKRTVQPLSEVKTAIHDKLLQDLQGKKEQAIYDSAKKAANIKVLVKASDL
jgi:foldase protein PrsA